MKPISFVAPFLLLLMLLLYTRPSAQAATPTGLPVQLYLPIMRAGCNDFYESFRQPAAGWPSGPVVQNGVELGQWGVANEQFYIAINEVGAGYLIRPLAPAPGYASYVLTVDMQFTAPTTDGLVSLLFAAQLQETAVREYYLFEVEPEAQQFRLIHFQPDNSSRTIVDYTHSAAIAPGTAVNQLSVVYDQANITLAVNGTILGSWHDLGITEPGYTGFGFRLRNNQPAATATFDNYHLHTCLPETTTERVEPFLPQIDGLRPAVDRLDD